MSSKFKKDVNNLSASTCDHRQGAYIRGREMLGFGQSMRDAAEKLV